MASHVHHLLAMSASLVSGGRSGRNNTYGSTDTVFRPLQAGQEDSMDPEALTIRSDVAPIESTFVDPDAVPLTRPSAVMFCAVFCSLQHLLKLFVFLCDFRANNPESIGRGTQTSSLSTKTGSNGTPKLGNISLICCNAH